MRFYAKASSFRTQITPGGMKPHPETPNLFLDQPGVYAQFTGGQFDTAAMGFSPEEEERAIKKLRSHPDYGYGKAFWTEADRPASVSQEERVAELEAKVKAYERMMQERVVVVEREGEKTGLARLNALKQEAAKAGIPPEKGWKAEDYERALAAATVMKEG